MYCTKSKIRSTIVVMLYFEGVGALHLYFGCHTPLEQIYRSEIQDLLSKDIISSYQIAFSRLPGCVKVSTSNCLIT